MSEVFSRDFEVGNEGEIRTFRFEKVWYGINLKYKILADQIKPLHMVKDNDENWKFEYPMIVPLYVLALEKLFSAAINENKS